MVEAGSGPERRSAFGEALATRRRGPADGQPGIRLHERRGLTIWQIAAWRVAEVAPLRSAVAEWWGCELPVGPHAAGAAGVVAFRIAPRRWWLVAKAGDAMATRLVETLAGRAALTDLSHARSVLRCGGPAARDALARLCRIDLHPRALPAGCCAQTMLGQIPTLIHVVEAMPCFDLYLPRSLAGSGLGSVLDAAEAFGLATDG